MGRLKTGIEDPLQFMRIRDLVFAGELNKSDAAKAIGISKDLFSKWLVDYKDLKLAEEQVDCTLYSKEDKLNKVQELKAKGLTQMQVVYITCLSRSTVKRYWNVGSEANEEK